MTPIITLTNSLVLLSLIVTSSFSLSSSDHQQQLAPVLPAGNLTSTPIPSYPTIQSPSGGNLTCRLDLSSELFGGVSAACSSSTPLDRSRCCPVLAAWLFAAHARSALSLPSPPPPAVSSPLADDVLPLMPDDSQKCVDSLHSSLESRNIKLPRPNATCDTVLCFCGIRLHQIGSLSCPAAFNVTAAAGEKSKNGSAMATPTAAVRELEKDCRNSSYAGCTRCLQSLEKLKGGKPSAGSSGGGDRAAKMFSRDCKLMGLTWLLAKNKTAYIPTVSAVLRAILYTEQQQQPYNNHYTYKCSPDQENMPLAVDSLQFQKLDSSSSSTFALRFRAYLLAWALFLVL